MAKNTQLTNIAVNAEGDALVTLADHGWIDVLGGTQPATGDTAITTQTVLVSLRLSTPAAGSTSAGVITFSAVTSGTAVATGTATWFRVYKSDHTTALFDGTVDTSGANLNFSSTTSIVSGQTISVSAFTHTLAKATSGS